MNSQTLHLRVVSAARGRVPTPSRSMLPRLRVVGAYRTFSTSNISNTVKDDLRCLLRETAQPVAVVTALMPERHKQASSSPHMRFHGATLSSFSSIAMDPHPLVAFSLRIPSRMATSLKEAHLHWPSHMVINILACAQAELAVRFSRPDLHASPFADVQYTLSEEGLPVLDDSIGALSCQLVTPPWPLHNIDALRRGEHPGELAWEGDGVASELFIARVTRVEVTPEDASRTPLLYHRRAYATTIDLSTPAKSPK